MKLEEPANPPEGDWKPAQLVGGGAFCMFVGVTPNIPATTDPNDVREQTWSIQMDLNSTADGEVSMLLQEGGALTAVVKGGDQDGNVGSINMPDAAAKEGPPHLAYFTSKNVYAIIIYPVWNGIVVTSGIQDVRPSVDSASLFIPKRKEASILESPYSTPFDPENPDEVEVNVGDAGAGTDVLVDMGDEVQINAKNCRVELAYLPCYFSPRMWMDEWFLANSDTENATYNYDTWPIWTANNTAYDFDPTYGVVDPDKPGPVDSNTQYYLAKWRFEETADNEPSRVGPQLFGSLLRSQETLTFGIRNGNGQFDISVSTSGTPGDPSPTSDWSDYIQNVSVSIGREGTTGSMTVDKFGFAGQEAIADQDVGLVRLSINGGYNTNLNSSGSPTGNTEFFIGFGMGLGDTKGPDGATWQIPLVGLEKKMDDIMLVNAPFVDGWTANDVYNFLLLRYAGIGWTNRASTAILTNLRISEDIETPVFNWQSGTTVRAALDEASADVLLTYYVQNGRLYVYTIGADGFPIQFVAQPDWSLVYDDVQVTSVDQTPIFDNLRNEIIVVGMEEVVAGTGTEIADLPLFPKVHLESQVTTPDIPWAKRMVYVTQGVLDGIELEDIADNIKLASKTYDVTGRVTIPGNANIELFDNWGDYIITSITHNIDLQGKSFTTDLEFSGGSR